MVRVLQVVLAKPPPKGAASSSSKCPATVSKNWPCPVCKVVLTAKNSSEKAVNAKLGEMRTNHIVYRHAD